MSEHDDPPPLDQDVVDLVVAERRRPEAPLAAKEEVLDGLNALLMGGGVPPELGGVAPPAPPSISVPRALALAAVTFALGGVVGAYWQHRRAAPPELAPAPPVSTPVTSGAPSAASSPLLPPVASRPSASSVPEPPSRAAPVVPSVKSASDASTADVSLAKERLLIDRARAAIARGRAVDAQQAVDEHAREFPRGQLAEEREALAVQALAQAGRTREATQRAAAFRKRWPDSVLTPVVDEAVR
jgi:hypothetical protein